MSSVFGLLAFVCFIALIVGLIRPKAVIRWGLAEKRTRGKVLLYYGIGLIVLFIFSVAMSSNTNDSSMPTKAEAKTDAKAKADADAKAKADADAKAKADADTKAKADADAKNPKWNVKDTSFDTNGNGALALSLLKVMGDISQKGIVADAGNVFKAPWNYYGKPTKLSGSVVIVQDYPPGSEEAKTGLQSQVVLSAQDSTPIIVFSTVPSGNLKVDDEISVVGYPVGLESVDNKLGGKTDELVMITNKLQ